MLFVQLFGKQCIFLFNLICEFVTNCLHIQEHKTLFWSKHLKDHWFKDCTVLFQENA